MAKIRGGTAGRRFEEELARWFSRDALEPHPSPIGADAIAYRRQMNMALALAASKWMEFEADEPATAELRMQEWLGATAARAQARKAAARAEAMRIVSAWLRG